MTLNLGDGKWQSLLPYNIYRIFSFLLLVGLWLSNYKVYHASPLLILSVTYGFFTALAFYCWYHKKPKFSTQVLISGVIDIVIISLYVSFLAQLQTGLAVLINVNVAILSLLVPGRLAIFFAAIASMMLLIICSIDYLYAKEVDSSIFFYSGIHGVGLFATAIVAWFLARRLQTTELLAKERGSQLADMQKINQYIVEKLRAGVIYVNLDGTISVMNSSAKQMLNYQESSMPVYIHELSPNLGLNFSHYIDRSKGKPKPSTVILKRLSLRIQYIPMTESFDGSCLIILENIHNITQQAQQLKLASLGRFSASIAHELRNPLGAISHAVQLMGENGLTDEDQKLQRLIEKHCNRMNEVVKNVLQLSRREKAKPVSIELNRFLPEFARDYHSYPACQIIYEQNDTLNTTISFDQSQLEQVLVILCDNAVQHNLDHSEPISITMQVVKEHNNVCLEIIDNGKGIEHIYHNQLFEPFFTTNRSGHGMGLFIAKELAEINDAILRYDNSNEEGCCFRLEFGNKEIEYYD